MRSHGFALYLFALAGVLSGCGLVGSAQDVTGPNDVLAGQPPRSLAQLAQTYLRTGHYTFASVGAQASSSALRGVPAELAPLLNGSGRWTASGVVAGTRLISVRANIIGAGELHAVEVGCDGYASVNGSLWAQGETERSLARVLSPAIDDAGISGATWHDLGSSVVDGVLMRHLHAELTPLALTGATASPDATPPPGVAMQASTMDLWIRSSDGSVAEQSVHIDLSADYSKNSMARQAGVTGALRSVLTVDQKLQPSRVSVQAPLATLASDPVPQLVRIALGPLGAAPDACATNKT